MDGMLRVRFQNCAEIRMGSPFQVCHLHLEGSWIPDVVSGDGWQNVSASSPDGRFIGLVQWDVTGNEPGFRIVTVDCVAREVIYSGRKRGCCQALTWREGRFDPAIWHAPSNEEL
jgi:hypothetical protein